MTTENTAVATETSTKTKTKRVAYRFTLTLPEAFTIRQLQRSKRGTVQYITLYKRIESMLKKGEIKAVGQFRAKAKRGRLQTIYTRSNVENVQLALEKAGFKGDLRLTNVEVPASA